jgi:D-tyrosyl-tRNA(Tyr) deacylase
MRAVVQRVSNCSINVEKRITGSIDRGLLVYLGVGKDDTQTDVQYLADKVLNLRIFEDSEGKMNLSVLDRKGGILVVSQFTLHGDTRKGRRPSYNDAALPEIAIPLYESFLNELKRGGITPEKGVFGAYMEVSYTNTGPVTILIDSKKKF